MPAVNNLRQDGRFFLIFGSLISLIGMIWPHAIFWIASGISPQRASHSWYIDGYALPLETRLSGVYIGIALTLLLLIFAGRVHNWGFANPQILFVLLLGLMPMVIDGANAVLYDLGWRWFYLPTADLRLITGTLFGTCVTHLLLPVLNLNLHPPGTSPQPTDAPHLTQTGDLLPIILLGPLVWGIAQGSGALTWLILIGLSMSGLTWFVTGAWLLLFAFLQHPYHNRTPLALTLAILSLALWGAAHHLAGFTY
ncbi:MAG: DUF2085 domain-containing protein [Chloroflexi bacterium]|nr:DUF2085 domain-containing protein [Chloroflexota bacterium]